MQNKKIDCYKHLLMIYIIVLRRRSIVELRPRVSCPTFSRGMAQRAELGNDIAEEWKFRQGRHDAPYWTIFGCRVSPTPPANL